MTSTRFLRKTESFATCVIITFTLGCFFTSTDARAETNSQYQPNVLLIVTDDQRQDTIAALGNDIIRTPNLDALVARGSVFTRAICANPICTPSRGEILTGCNGFNNGLIDFGGRFREGLTPIAQTLGNAGYRTYHVGKWHNAGRPSQHGYQESIGLFTGGGGKFWKDQVDAHGREVTGYRGWIFQSDGRELYPEHGVGLTPNISERFADAAIEAISTHSDSPFFVHVNFTAPHDPLLTPDGYEGAYNPNEIPLPTNFAPQHPFDTGNIGGRDEVLLPTPRTKKDVREDIAVYYAVISHLDAQVGRILKRLDASGQRENTIVIFTSDHGLAMGSHGLRGKQNMYEHTMNVPMLMSGPSIPIGKNFNAQIYLRDLYPTICELTGVGLPNAIDGRSVVPILRGDDTTIHPHVFGYFRNFQRMVRGDRWKLIQYPQIDRWQLFDLASDPSERNNLADDLASSTIKRDLQDRLRQWQLQVGDPLATKVLPTGAIRENEPPADNATVGNTSNRITTLVLQNDFSDEAVGTYTDEDFKADRDWGNVRWAHFDDRAEIINIDGNKKLRLKFPKAKFGHSETGGNAAVSIGTHSEIYQRATVRFEPGFSFVKTGKIVGVGSGAGWSGGHVPREGEGYTSRFIWDRDHEAAMYLYHMDQQGKYGDVVKLGFKFRTGVDYTLTQRIKANSGSKKDGTLQVWVSENGGQPTLVVDRNDLRFGTNGRGKTELLFVAPFHGGGDSSFAAAETSYLTLDDFFVSTEKFSDLP